MDNAAIREIILKLQKIALTHGRSLSSWEAEPTAWALDYLRRRGVTVLTIVERASSLDPRERAAFQSFYSECSKWATGKALARCKAVLAILASVQEHPPVFTERTARLELGPICGWWQTGRRGFCSKMDWRQKAAA